MALTRQQIQENIRAIRQQGGTDEQIQRYLNTVTLKEDEPQQPKERPEFPKPESIFKSFGKAITTSERRLGKTIASSISGNIQGKKLRKEQDETASLQDATIKRIREKRARGEDVSRLLVSLSRSSSIPENVPTIEDVAPDLDKTNSQILGEAAGVAVDALGFGPIAARGGKIVTQIAKGSRPILAGTLRSAKQGAVTGAGFGAAEGAALGLQNEEGVLLPATVGALGGGVGGGVLGGIFGGTTKFLTGRKARQKEVAELLTSGELTNKKLADIDINDIAVKHFRDGSAPEIRINNLKKDVRAAEALRQGFDDTEVALVKAMSGPDKKKAREMFDIAVKAKNDKRFVKRPLDVVGDTIIRPVKVLEDTLQSKAKELNKVAESLKGESVNSLGDVVLSVQDELNSVGARVRRNVIDDVTFIPEGRAGLPRTNKNSIDFSGSSLEGLGNNEKILNNVYDRILDADDALDLHNIKKFIDSNVDFGKRSEGLVGQSENILKSWRRTIDQALDGQFDDYKLVNDQLSDVINQLDQVGDIMGRRFNTSEPLSNIRAGQVASRILGNSANRGDIMTVLNNLQKTAGKFGHVTDEDIISQVLFADMLEDTFRTPATRSLQGQTTRALEQATGVAGDLARGNLLSGITRGAAQTINLFRGINPKAKRESLLNLIQANN